MMFRLGVLVLLLALRSVLAEHRWPTVHKITVPSSVRSLKQTRGRFISASYSSVRSLSKKTFCRSLKSNNDICAWDPSRKECSLSAARMLSLVKKSNTELSKIVIEELECAVKTNKDDCNIDESCLWNREMDVCEYNNPRIQFNNSACIQAAPLFFDFLEAVTDCEKLSSRHACKKTKQCEWSSDDGYCQQDFFFVVFGIENFLQKFEKVLESGLPMLGTESSDLRSSANFTWETFLAYEFSSIECPSHIEQLVCNFTNTWIDRIWGSILYCSGKYESLEAAECTADELCSWHYNTNECAFKGSLYTVATADALNVIVDSLSDGINKKLFNMVFMCLGISAKESCNGNCIWNAADTYCDVKNDALAQPFQEIAEKSNDAFCRFLVLTISSPCSNQYTKKSCNKTEFCHWHESGECLQNEELYISAAADEDRKLKRRYKKSKKVCSKFKIKSTCPV